MMQMPAAALRLPALREDLRLHGGDAAGQGHSLVYDPIAHRYHELDAQTFAMLGLWRSDISVAELAAIFSGKLAAAITPEDVLALAQTLDRAGLLAEPMQGWKSVYSEQQRKRKNPAAWLLHNYLFIRVPLMRPDRFLQATLPLARIFASRFVLILLALTGLSGLYMVSRQWDAFSHTFLHFFSLEGAAGYLAAIAFVKIFHELGHAYMARHFGCRVPAMGVAFMVLTPMFYTDVSDAWRLQSRRQRMLISAAGMMVEFGIAAVATFLWAFLPEGFLKSACFFIATVSWVMSLAINLSPLMRFDGYYLLSDYWGISNLQPRTFALMRWQIREILFGLRAECPEDWTARRRAMVIAYALCACLYRLMLFVGIALLVYHATFKMLGILLFAVEIIWFVLLPVAMEIRVWWAIREQIREGRRWRFSVAATACAVAALAVPWPHRIEMPAVVEPVAMQRVAMPFGAKIIASHVKDGDKVLPGDVLFTLESPKLVADITAARTQLELLHVRRARRMADQADREQSIMLAQDIARAREKLAGLERLRGDLVMRANVAGTIRDMMPDIHGDRWAARGDELAIVVAAQGLQVRGYLPEAAVMAVRGGARGFFVPDEPLTAKMPVQLEHIAASSVSSLDLSYLASTHGGAVAVNEDREKGSIPIEAQYQALMALEAAPSAHPPVMRGVVWMDATPDSLMSRVAKRAAAVLIRESGF